VKKQKSRRLVVDASVVRSAGTTDHPVSKACRDTLFEILTTCHKVVITPDIVNEWKKHRSQYSTIWMASMVARKKIIKADIPPNEFLRREFTNVGISEKDLRAVIKDVHLIDAALAMDKTIISCDQALRDILTEVVTTTSHISRLMYVNPAQNVDVALKWLKEGANSDKIWFSIYRL